MKRALLFDLDETLMVEEPAAEAAFLALKQLGVEAAAAVMAGDSISKDVDGALAAGLGAVWVNRSARQPPPDRVGLVEISTLDDLPDALGQLE